MARRQVLPGIGTAILPEGIVSDQQMPLGGNAGESVNVTNPFLDLGVEPAFSHLRGPNEATDIPLSLAPQKWEPRCLQNGLGRMFLASGADAQGL